MNDDEVRFINFRHWAVMVVAYKRNSMYMQMIGAGIKAFISSPTDFVEQVTGFIGKIRKHK